MILRRLYLYVVSAAALGVLAAGLSLLGSTVLLFAFNDPSAQYSRTDLATYSAMSLVALPIWGIHFYFARRFAMRDLRERASSIRRAYVYAACLAASIGATSALVSTISWLLAPVLDGTGFNRLDAAQFAWVAGVLLAVWWFHYRIASRDRSVAGESGRSATMRRWYMYGALLFGLLVMLFGVATFLQLAWTKLVTGSLQPYQSLSGFAGWTAAGAMTWGFHTRSIAQHHVTDDRHSTLRALEGFTVIAVSIAAALFGASEILYYGLARILGIDNPGGAGTNLLAALSGPASSLLVFGAAWLLTRRRLTRDAAAEESDRQAGIRRLYTNLAALVSLATAATGAGGLLATLLEQLEGPLIGVTPGGWQDPASLWVTLLLVGAAAWLAHWRHAPPDPERRSLSRRIYLWTSLIASVLALLVGGVGVLNAILRQVFSATPTLKDPANLDVGQFLAVIAAAAVVGVYHLRVLRADGAARPALKTTEPASSSEPTEGPSAPAMPAAPAETKPPTDPQGLLDLVDWRRRVGDIYRTSGPDAATRFRQARDELFRTHPQSPIEAAERESFWGLSYFPHDASFRIPARFEPGDGSELLIETGGADGAVRYRRAGVLTFQVAGTPCRLTVLSLVQYAGGLFLPFRDATSGHETYGGGRYLFDTAKDTDGLVLDITPGSPEVTIDFNYAYNASCAYSPLWACPLAPPENYLSVPIRAGELVYKPA
ncbi:MAG: DUF5671 domain-containing protein [Candidatus Dormibacterales bacterium]